MFRPRVHSRVFAVVTALGLVGIIALQVLIPIREAEAKECNSIISFNASKGDENRSMNVETVSVLFIIAAIFGLVGVVVIDSIMTIQEAEAKGCPLGTPAPNASKGQCFRG